MSVENSKAQFVLNEATSEADRREAERIQILLPLRITESKTNRLLGRLIDLSLKGCRLAGPENFAVDEVIESIFNLERAIPGSGILTIKLKARWSRPSKDLSTKGVMETGFEFVRPAAEDLEALKFFMGRSTFLGDWLRDH